MPYATARDGTKLYYESAGRGTPLVFVHEFSGDYRSWEAQMRFFSRRYRCVAFNARGYPPSDVPKSVAKYSQNIVVDDIAEPKPAAGQVLVRITPGAVTASNDSAPVDSTSGERADLARYRERRYLTTDEARPEAVARRAARGTGCPRCSR